MTITLTALTNDKARLIASKSTTDSESMAKVIEAEYLRAGYIVTASVEE